MNNFNKGKNRNYYYLIILQIMVTIFVFSPIIRSQAQFSGSVETDKYNFEYELTNLNIPNRFIYSLTISKENKIEIKNKVSVPDTIKLFLYLTGYAPNKNSSIWGKFQRRSQNKNMPPYQIFIKGTNGYFKTDEVLANYEYRNLTTVELYVLPKIIIKKKRDAIINTFNPKYAVEDALELFIKASFD